MAIERLVRSSRIGLTSANMRLPAPRLTPLAQLARTRSGVRNASRPCGVLDPGHISARQFGNQGTLWEMPLAEGDMMLRLRGTLWQLSLVLVAGCSESTYCRPGDARCLVVTAIQRESGQRDLPFDSSLVAITLDTSRAVSDLLYFEGDYFPPGTADIRLSARAAARDGRAALVKTVADWVRVAGNWSPQSAAEVTRACEEVAVLTSPPQLYSRPFVYQDTMTVRQLEKRFVMFRDTADLQLLSGPRTARRDTDWVASLWVIQARESVRYECGVTERRAAELTVELRRTDETDRVGMLWGP